MNSFTTTYSVILAFRYNLCYGDDIMNTEIANALLGYLETLYYSNQNLIKLCGTDIIDDYENREKEILDIIQDIPRLVPYSVNRITNKLECKISDGLLEYSEDIGYLKEDYDKILLENYDFLDAIRKIRNKYAHKMHGVKYTSSGSGNLSLFDFAFKINNDEIVVCAGQFIKLFKNINILFSKLVNDVETFAYQNKKDDYLYYRKITRFEFTDFNKIYDSDLLRTVGYLMKKF